MPTHIIPFAAPPAPAVPDSPPPKAALPHWKTDQLDRRISQFKPLLNALAAGAGEAVAVAIFARATGKSEATGRRWLERYRKHGVQGLAPDYRGRQRRPQAWDARAQELLTLPSKPNCGEVASRLRVEGFRSQTDNGEGAVQPAQVRRFHRTLPSNLAETSPKRLGRNRHRLTETPYVIREWGHVPVGYLYELDGHTCDFYIEHPVTGGYFRPELTFVIDVRSQYLVDFWIGGFENATDLRWLLSRAFLQHDHVCHELHVDPGAAAAREMSDLVSGFCAKLAVDIHFALPGNARGKGLIEGEYKIFEGRFGKLAMAATYLHNRTDEALRLFADKWKKGLVPRITVHQLYELILRDYVTPRRTEPRPGLGGASPAELWATLVRNPVLAPASAVCRPRKQAVVQNRRVRIHNRRYQDAVLAQYEDRPVIVEYDDWHDDKVWLYDLAGNFIGTAALVGKKPGVPESRVAERLAKTAEGQRKRLLLKLAETEDRARVCIMPAQAMDALEGPELPASAPDTAVRVLGAGHSFAALPAPTAKAAGPAPAAPLMLRELEAELAAEQAPQPEEETAAQRYARALALHTAGDAVSAEDARWLSIYQESAEYSAQALLADPSN